MTDWNRVKDYDQKKFYLKSLHNIDSDEALYIKCKELVTIECTAKNIAEYPISEDALRKTLQTSQPKSNNTQNTVSVLVKLLNKKCTYPASIDDFIWLPHEYLKEKVEYGVIARNTKMQNHSPNAVYFGTTKKLVSEVTEDLETKMVDQAAYYESVDAAESWVRVSKAKQYTTPNECCERLKELVADPLWTEYLNSNPDGRINLLTGGGSPFKDEILLNSIKNSQNIQYYIFDTSIHMHRLSYSYIEDEAEKELNFRIRRVLANVTKLPNYNRKKMGLNGFG